MLDLLRRVAVLSLISVAGIGLLAPLTARSGSAETHTPAALLVDSRQLTATTIDRTLLAGRDESATLALAGLGRVIGPERLRRGESLSRPASPGMKATLYLRPPAPSPAPTATPVARVAPPTMGYVVRGAATWYCCSIGYRGQAAVALPGALGGAYDPPPASHFVTVCADRCARLPVVDYCGCEWGTAAQKVADLSPEAWAAVTDQGFGAGIITVTIQFDG